ncbi:MAG TPA: hypothetical protein VHM90_10050, partial [Phycisphaerae bacterium]|nr:hypothetical protein [Phycisphaerae bacterium]
VRDVPLAAFEILVAVRFSEARVAEALQRVAGGMAGGAGGAGGVGGAGPVEVKTRGGLPGIDTDRLQRVWSKAAPCGRTVLLFSYGGDVAAVIARRLPA